MKGERPDMPENIAEFKDVEDMIKTTWRQDPDDRPTATHIKQVLEKQLKGNEHSHQEMFPYDLYTPIRYFHSFIYIWKLFIT